MNIDYEKIKLKKGYFAIIGCDEVGRGCLAGPVVAGAVILPIASISLKDELLEVKDSKQLTAKNRERLEVKIKSESLGWGIGVVGEKIIDEINIHHASLLAMKKAVKNLQGKLKYDSIVSQQILLAVDGKFCIPEFYMEQEAIVDGDAKILSIAAASIIAKVYRDKLMTSLDKTFPGYKFSAHKGYATFHHREAIKKLGLTPIHRLSFCGNYL